MKEKTFKKRRTSITSQLDKGSVPHRTKYAPPHHLKREENCLEENSVPFVRMASCLQQFWTCCIY
ncbi:rCG36206 [Rattus norvegicus]|uniref:RCG36206 n=1 Tax=Rattus norvegicus TaxID=10116 RepID=A6KUN3_RAT|nr:rCG36206 [Rattus norvegicus]